MYLWWECETSDCCLLIFGNGLEQSSLLGFESAEDRLTSCACAKLETGKNLFLWKGKINIHSILATKEKNMTLSQW